MIVYNMHDAKSQLSKLVKLAEEGEEVVIARQNSPVVRIVSIKNTKDKRTPGRLAGKIKLATDFLESNDDLLEQFSKSIFPNE